MRPPPVGLRHRLRFDPGPEDTAGALGNASVAAVGTAVLVLAFEDAADRCVSAYYEAGEVAVGTRVEVDHLAPAWAGTPIDIEAELTAVEGRRLEFELEARQGETVVMRGRHARAVVSAARFAAPAGHSPERAPASIEFWFDFHSPWCYLASHRVGAIARRHGATLTWRPVHLAKLNAALDGRRPLEANAPFVEWYRQDLLDQAALLDLPYAEHPRYPLRPARAQRAALLAADRGLAEPFVKRIMRGYWSQSLDIESPGALADAASEVGLDPDAVARACEDGTYRARVDANLDAAIARRVFGLPMTFAGGKRFFGNDRLDLLDHHLSGRAPRLGPHPPVESGESDACAGDDHPSSTRTGSPP